MDGVCCPAPDARAVTPAIDDAVAHGVPVMTFDSDAPDSRRFAYCGVDDVKAGERSWRSWRGWPARRPRRGAGRQPRRHQPQPPRRGRAARGGAPPRHQGRRHLLHGRDARGGERDRPQIGAAHPEIEGWAMVGGWALYTKTLLRGSGPRRPAPAAPARPVKIVSINALPPQLAYVEAGLAPVLLAQPTYLWGAIGVDAIVDKLTGGSRFRRTSTPSWCGSPPTTSASGRVSCAPGASPTCPKSCCR